MDAIRLEFDPIYNVNDFLAVYGYSPRKEDLGMGAQQIGSSSFDFRLMEWSSGGWNTTCNTKHFGARAGHM